MRLSERKNYNFDELIINMKRTNLTLTKLSHTSIKKSE